MRIKKRTLSAAGTALALGTGGAVAYAASSTSTATCTANPAITDEGTVQSFDVHCSVPMAATATVTTTADGVTGTQVRQCFMVVEVEPLHHQSDGLADGPAGVKCHHQGVLAPSLPHGDGSLGGQEPRPGQLAGIEGGVRCGVDVQPTQRPRPRSVLPVANEGPGRRRGT